MIETGVLFGDLHSYRDLNLICSGIDIPPASPKEKYIDVPGADGSIDMTEALGEIKYADRMAKFTFSMNPAGDLSEAAWEAKKKEISNHLNGLRCNITLDKNPGYYWEGRCKVDSFASNKRKRQIVVGARLAPYKLKTTPSADVSVLTESANKVTLTNNGRKTVCPEITIKGGSGKIVYDGTEYALSEGKHKIPALQLYHGKTVVSVSGTGTIGFKYREGDL